jgi:hypothetical protein
MLLAGFGRKLSGQIIAGSRRRGIGQKDIFTGAVRLGIVFSMRWVGAHHGWTAHRTNESRRQV